MNILSESTYSNKLIVPRHYILVDGSYFIFYRFHALTSWWRRAKIDQLEVLNNPAENAEFVEKFKAICAKKLNELDLNTALAQDGKQNIKGNKKSIMMSYESVLIIAKDCPRENIWRTALYPEYKATRTSTPNIYPFFKLFYDEIIPKYQERLTSSRPREEIRAPLSPTPVPEGTGSDEKPLNCHIVSHPHFEADDCVAVGVKQIQKKIDSDAINPVANQSKIFIIASDKDYLQIAEDNKVIIMTANFEIISERKSSTGSKEADLFCKIVLGDKSDNISGVFENCDKIKCGPKTALKLFGDKDKEQIEFNKLLAQGGDAVAKKYELNRRLIDFHFIPEAYSQEFIKQYFC